VLELARMRLPASLSVILLLFFLLDLG